MPTKSTKKTPAPVAEPLISSNKLQQLYTTMLKCRVLGPHMHRLDGPSFWKVKEAVAVAATIDLQPEDAIVTFSGAAIASFLKGAPLLSIFSQANCIPKARNAVARVQPATQCALATGIVVARSAERKDGLTVAFLSEFPDESRTGREALQLAGLLKLPILYVCAAMPLDADQANSCGLPVIPVDGSDVVAAYRVVHECAVRARQGGGPSVIACVFGSGIKNPSNAGDPLRIMERYLSAKGLFSKRRKQSTILAFEKAIETAEKAARGRKTPQGPQRIYVV